MMRESSLSRTLGTSGLVTILTLSTVLVHPTETDSFRKGFGRTFRLVGQPVTEYYHPHVQAVKGK